MIWLKIFMFGLVRGIIMLFLMIVSFSCSIKEPLVDKNNSDEFESEGEKENLNSHLSINNYVSDIVNHSAFKGFGELLLPLDDNSRYYNTSITDIGSLMPYHGNIHPDIVIGAVNYMIDEVADKNIIFYDFYTELQKQRDPGKRNTGLFFYRGKPDAPFAVVCPGGGFSYVGSLHEGFPLAWEISQKGLNAFVIRYRIGNEQRATEDLAAAITYIFRNANSLRVSTNGYSLWGSSAGARMVGNIALNGIKDYGDDDLPKPSAVIIAYTGQSSYSNDFPPAFITVSEDDWIVNVSTVERRIENLRKAGVKVEYHRYKNAGHGFGLGNGTDAEGWLNLAIHFWEDQFFKKKR